MKIEYGSKTKLVRFDDLGSGEVFRRDTENRPYIRTDEENEDGDTYAVRLDNGSLYGISGDEMVTPVSAKVVVLDGTGDRDD